MVGPICEAADLYIQSQGWLIRPDRHDDGGFSGGKIERPALKRLITDIENGKVVSTHTLAEGMRPASRADSPRENEKPPPAA